MDGDNDSKTVGNVGGAISAVRAYHKSLPAHVHASHEPVRTERLWEGQKLIDLRDDFDEGLLHRFYDELMVPNFPIKEELDDVEMWEDGLEPSSVAMADPRAPHLHILLALESENIMAGMVWEYYPVSNCVLVSYMVVAEGYRGRGLMKTMQDMAFVRAQSLAQEVSGSSPRAIFAESNAPGVDDGVMDIAVRHRVLYKLGYRQLKFAYTQPPLAPGELPCFDLVLLVYMPDLQMSEDDVAERPCLAGEIVAAYIEDFAHSIFGFFDDSQFNKERYYTDMLYCCTLAPTLEVLPRLPQTRLGCKKHHIAVEVDDQEAAQRAASEIQSLGCKAVLNGATGREDISLVLRTRSDHQNSGNLVIVALTNKTLDEFGQDVYRALLTRLIVMA